MDSLNLDGFTIKSNMRNFTNKILNIKLDILQLKPQKLLHNEFWNQNIQLIMNKPVIKG